MKKKSLTKGLFFDCMSTILQIIFISFRIPNCGDSTMVMLRKKPDFLRKTSLMFNWIIVVIWHGSLFLFYWFFCNVIGFIKCLIKLSFIAKVWIEVNIKMCSFHWDNTKTFFLRISVQSAPSFDWDKRRDW